MMDATAIRILFGLAGVFAAALPRLASADADSAIHAYAAVYQVRYEGRDRGTSEFSVDYDTDRGVYTFRSSTKLRGILLRIAAPRAIVERSEFVSERGRIKPLEFWFEDGTRRGNDNFHLLFDWDNGAIITEKSDVRVIFNATPGVLDRATSQVQVMLDAARSSDSHSYSVADEDGPQTYDYTEDGDEVIQTPYGEFKSHLHIQQRAGSSRQTLFWTSPQLRHLPVRIEQRRNGETRLVFLLESLEWLDAPEG